MKKLMMFTFLTIALVGQITLAQALPDIVTPEDCPVVGNTKSQIFHTQGQPNYKRMLVKNQSGTDNRKCFKSEDEAVDAGYRKSRSGKGVRTPAPEEHPAN